MQEDKADHRGTARKNGKGSDITQVMEEAGSFFPSAPPPSSPPPAPSRRRPNSTPCGGAAAAAVAAVLALSISLPLSDAWSMRSTTYLHVPAANRQLAGVCPWTALRSWREVRRRRAAGSSPFSCMGAPPTPPPQGQKMSWPDEGIQIAKAPENFWGDVASLRYAFTSAHDPHQEPRKKIWYWLRTRDPSSSYSHPPSLRTSCSRVEDARRFGLFCFSCISPTMQTSTYSGPGSVSASQSQAPVARPHPHAPLANKTPQMQSLPQAPRPGRWIENAVPHHARQYVQRRAVSLRHPAPKRAQLPPRID